MFALTSPFYFPNNEFIPSDTARLAVSDLAIQRGYGIFDFLRTVNNRPLFIKEHLQRFFNSAAEMRLPLTYTIAELEEIIRQLIQKNNIPDSGIRITLTGGYSADGYSIAPPNFIIMQQPLTVPDNLAFEKGIKLITYEHRRQLPQVKTIDYLMAIWLQPLVKEKGADDVLYIKDGKLTECPRANIFLVTNNEQIITPGSDILKGITRGKIIKEVSSQFSIEIRDVFIEEIKKAKEVFITSSTKKVLPVVQIDAVTFNSNKPGPITREIASLFTQLLSAKETISNESD